MAAPGLLESVAPFWGEWRQGQFDFHCGRYGWGVVHSALAVSDVFLVKAVVVGVGKFAWRGMSRLAANELFEMGGRAAVKGEDDLSRGVGSTVDDFLPEAQARLDATKATYGNVGAFNSVTPSPASLSGGGAARSVGTRWGPHTGTRPLGKKAAGTSGGGSYTELATSSADLLKREVADIATVTGS